MVGRYELSEAEWELVKEIVTKPERMGRPRRDDHQMLNGIFWILYRFARLEPPQEALKGG